MEKSKLSSIGERLKSSGAQMSRLVSLKMREMKDLLQTPTPESKIVDQATSFNLESPDWGLNLRICAMINGEELSGAEVVRAIKRKICGGDARCQRLGLELLEACAMNCEKVFSEIASEKVVEEMVKLIENPQADRECQVRAMELLRAWGESEDLSYLPVFHQTYEMLKQRGMPSHAPDGSFPPMHYSLESYIDEQPLSPPEHYPIPTSGTNSNLGTMLHYSYGDLSSEQKKEFLEITRNSLELLSSLLNSTPEPNLTKDDLTITLLDKCKESQPVLQRIIQSTSEEEGLLFEALNLNDELQQVVSKFQDSQASSDPPALPDESNPTDTQSSQLEPINEDNKLTDSPKGDNLESDAVLGIRNEEGSVEIPNKGDSSVIGRADFRTENGEKK